jgi:hypothetical protein
MRVKQLKWSLVYTACHLTQLVIYEAASFIEEAHNAMKKKTSSADDNDHSFEVGENSKAMVFVRALRSTKLLERPGYIKIAKQANEQDSFRVEKNNLHSDV